MDISKWNAINFEKELYKDSYYDFVVNFWPVIESHELRISPYLEYLCKEVQIIFNWVADWKTQDDTYDLLINVPPGTSKSTIISKMGPAYLWTLNIDAQVIATSYSSDPVKEFTAKFLKILNSDEFQQLYPHIQLSMENVKKQKNMAKGTRFATSTNGSIVGMHGDIILVDDHNKPPKIIRDDNGNPKLAQGATITEILNGNAWHDDVLTSRKTDKEYARTIYVQQRVHRNDLTGYLLKKAENGAMNLKHINLPAEIDSTSDRLQAFSKTYREGEVVEKINLSNFYSKDGLLDPLRLPKKILEQTKKVMGQYAYNAQYLEKPSRDKGGLIKPKWFPIVDAGTLPSGLVKFFFTDPSEGKPTSDNMATICWSLWEGKMYIWELQAVVKPFLEFIGFRDQQGEWVDKDYDKFVKKHGTTRQSLHFFEAKSSGSQYIQYLNSQTPYNALEELPKGSKIDRVTVVYGNWQAGRVCLVKNVEGVNQDWIPDLLDEVANFTGKDGDPDDRVDVLSAATKLTEFVGSSFILENNQTNNTKSLFN